MKKILFILMFLLCACNNSSSLKYGTYKMINSPDNVPIIMTFDKDGRLNVKIVNIIMGQYTIDGEKIVINPAGSTMMMGPKNEMEAEQKFIQTLIMINSYKMDGDNLELNVEDGSKLLFVPYEEPEK